MHVLYNDPHRKPGLEEELGLVYASLDSLLRRADFVTVHTPLVSETHHLIDEAALRRMKRTAILVNAARGEIVNIAALVRALEEGWISGAALDVTDPEPIPADHPLVGMSNCIIVPHIGSATVTARDRMAEMAAENLLAGLQGERLPYCANPQVYE
jgi:phosphoglycerate dehydrogenase-like enzyme